MGSVNRVSTWIRKDHVGGEFPRFAAQSVDQPRAECWPPRNRRNSSVHVANRNLVTIESRVHRPNDADIVGNRPNVREEFRDLCTALASVGEFPGTAQQFFTRAIHKAVFHITRVIFSGAFLQFRFGVQQVHVRRTAMHEQRDHCIGLRLKMRIFQRQIKLP